MTHPLIRDCWMHLQERFIDRVLEEKPESVLDVGCGAGILLERLRDHGITTVGLDPSPRAMAALAKKNLEGVQGDAVELPFEDSSFDWVTMRHVAHHLADVPRAFAETLRVARRSAEDRLDQPGRQLHGGGPEGGRRRHGEWPRLGHRVRGPQRHHPDHGAHVPAI